jgi:hypothetical protein
MIDRFLARVGTLGAIAILTVAVLATGIAGGVEHFRLSAQHAEQQQTEQSRSQEQTQPGEQGSKQGDNTDKGPQSQDGEKGDHETETK